MTSFSGQPCTEYAIVHEPNGASLQVCGGQSRETWSYLSEVNSLDISITPQPTRTNRNFFLIHFQGNTIMSAILFLFGLLSKSVR